MRVPPLPGATSTSGPSTLSQASRTPVRSRRAIGHALNQTETMRDMIPLDKPLACTSVAAALQRRVIAGARRRSGPAPPVLRRCASAWPRRSSCGRRSACRQGRAVVRAVQRHGKSAARFSRRLVVRSRPPRHTGDWPRRRSAANSRAPTGCPCRSRSRSAAHIEAELDEPVSVGRAEIGERQRRCSGAPRPVRSAHAALQPSARRRNRMPRDGRGGDLVQHAARPGARDGHALAPRRATDTRVAPNAHAQPRHAFSARPQCPCRRDGATVQRVGRGGGAGAGERNGARPSVRHLVSVTGERVGLTP